MSQMGYREGTITLTNGSAVVTVPLPSNPSNTPHLNRTLHA